MTTNPNNYDIIYSLQRYFSDTFDIRAVWLSDGDTYPAERPFITLEYLTDERIERVKNREAVQVIEHLQLGYHALNIVDRTMQAESIADALTFNEIPYYNTTKSLEQSDGFFSVQVTSVVPMPASEASRHSEYNRVYFDVEIEKIKRRG